jgi:hypothetical protein
MDAAACAAVRADEAIPLGGRADHAALLAYARSSGAAEVAVFGRFAEEIGAALRGQGHNAYTLGPPRQTDLWRPSAPL